MINNKWFINMHCCFAYSRQANFTVKAENLTLKESFNNSFGMLCRLRIYNDHKQRRYFKFLQCSIYGFIYFQS